MRFVFTLIMLIFPIISSAVDQGALQHLTVNGGQLSLTFYHGNMRDSGLLVEGARQLDFQYDAATLSIPEDGGIGFLSDDGYFAQLEDGHLALDPGLTITAKGLRLESEKLIVKPKEFTRDTLLLSDEQGNDWFYLDYGHYERKGEWLYARFLDMRISHQLAHRLGDPTLQGHIVGYATLETRVNSQADAPQGTAEACLVEAPNWPTLDGYDADIAMLRIAITSQIARANGRVAIAPSAYFENIGTADVPWFSQFADTRDEDPCCLDQGDGACAPYANDQGGLLVYALYRYVDGRLEQIGQSQAKHAFNSVNMDTVYGSVACRTRNRSGRIVPSGCEDLYQAGTNAHQVFLGPREEVIAHTAVWNRDGSIWDQTGPAGIPDGNCDYMPANPLYGGQVPCMAPANDLMERRLSVAETDLTTPGARYFIETWYLARDDINVFNSFGRKEIRPGFTTVWTFPEVAPFQQGPVIDEFPALQDSSSHTFNDRLLSDEGHLQLSSSVSRIGQDLWQYDISLMNLDFDRAINGFDIPVPEGVNLTMMAFYDGDSDPDNDWLITTPTGSISYRSPDEVSLKWGSLVSFRFVADRAPTETTVTLAVAGAGIPATLDATSFSAIEILFEDGFE